MWNKFFFWEKILSKVGDDAHCIVNYIGPKRRNCIECKLILNYWKLTNYFSKFVNFQEFRISKFALITIVPFWSNINSLCSVNHHLIYYKNIKNFFWKKYYFTLWIIFRIESNEGCGCTFLIKISHREFVPRGGGMQ